FDAAMDEQQDQAGRREHAGATPPAVTARLPMTAGKFPTEQVEPWALEMAGEKRQRIAQAGLHRAHLSFQWQWCGVAEIMHVQCAVHSGCADLREPDGQV